MPLRQKIRRGLLLTAFLLFPMTIYYFSPALFLEGAANGILPGSALVFALLFLGSLFFGRLFCGWLCPAGGAQELIGDCRTRRVKRRRLGWIKFVLWVPWFSTWILLLRESGGVAAVRPFYMTAGGISVADLQGLFIYLAVVLLFTLPALIIGRRAGCHALCWMAPFMIAGERIARTLKIPRLHLAADPGACTDCGRCGRGCPMSIEIGELVRSGDPESVDCILCGACVDGCVSGAVRYVFDRGVASDST